MPASKQKKKKKKINLLKNYKKKKKERKIYFKIYIRKRKVRGKKILNISNLSIRNIRNFQTNSSAHGDFT